MWRKWLPVCVTITCFRRSDLLNPHFSLQELYTKKMFQLLCNGYSTICVGDAAIFLGMKEEDATNYALERGWTVDSASGMLTVKKQPVVSEPYIKPKPTNMHFVGYCSNGQKCVSTHRSCVAASQCSFNCFRRAR